jgi:DNA-binding response OmpR family regulator
MSARVPIENRGRVVALEQLFEELRARTDDAAKRAVKQHAHVLRKKCELAAGSTAERLHVEAVYGKGYRLTL